MFAEFLSREYHRIRLFLDPASPASEDMGWKSRLPVRMLYGGFFSSQDSLSLATQAPFSGLDITTSAVPASQMHV